MIATEPERAALGSTALGDDFHRSLLESVDTLVLALSPEFEVLYANPAYSAMVGGPGVRLEGQNLLELYPAFRQTRSFEAYQRVLAGGETQTVEGAFGDRTLLARVYRTPYGLVALGEDVTERRAAEKALAEAQGRLQVLLERLPQVVLYETGGGREYISGNIRQLMGYPAEALTGHAPYFPTLVDDRDEAEAREAFRRWREGGAEGVLRTEFRCRRQDGQELWLADFMVEVRPPEGPAYVSGVLVDITDRKVAEAAQARLAEQLGVAADTARRLSAILEPGRLVEETVEQLRERFRLYHAHVYLLDEAAGRLTVAAGSGEVGRALVAEGHGIALGSERSLVARAAVERQAVVSADVRADTRFLANPRLPDTRSEVALPLLAHGRLLGVLDLQDDAPDRFGPGDVDALSAVAGQIAVALENARLFSALGESQRRLDTLLTRVPQVVLYETGGEREYLSPNVSVLLGYPLERFETDKRFFPSLIHPEDLTRTDEEVAAWRAAGSAGVLNLEIRVRREDGTWLWLSDYMAEVRPEGGPSFISGVMVDISARKAAEAAQSRLAEQLGVAADTSRRLSAILEPERLLAETVEQVRERFGLYHVHLYLLDEAAARLRVAAGSGEVGRALVSEGHGIALGSERSLVAQAAAAGAAVVSPDVRADARFLANPRLPDTRSEVAVPMRVRGRLLGVLDAQHDAPDRFSPEDVDALSTLAGQIAVALENARLFEALGETERRLDTLFGRLPQVVLYETGGDREFISANVAALMGYPLARFQADRDFFPSLIHPDDVEEAHEAVRRWRAAGSQGVARIEFRARRADGTLLWLEDYMVDVRPEHGAKYMTGVMVDITERKAAEAERARFTGQLQVAAETARRLSTILDPERLTAETVQLLQERFGLYHVHLYLVDPAGERLLVRAGSGPVGRAMVAEGHALSLDAPQSLVVRAALTREAVRVDDTRTDPGFLPNPRLPETRSELAVPLLVRQRLVGVLDVQDDQPGRFGQPEVDTVSVLAGQIAVALDNARLYDEALRTADRLRQLDRLKSEFLANMSHELRTPLNSILGYAELLLLGLNGQLDPETIQDIQTIYDNGQQLLGLINDILDLAKIEAGQMRLDLSPVDVAGLLAEVKTANAVLVLAKPITLHLEVAEGLPPISGDRLRLLQVMNNLVSNAVKFTNEGEVWLRAYAEAGEVCLEVTDTGIGISEADMAAIFDKFSQVDGSYTRRARGTGLGLAITQHVVAMHGGSIQVTSRPGAGSTFVVRLPAADPARPWKLE